MDHPKLELDERGAAFLDRLRALCMAYPEVIEAEQFGHPWWKAGSKSFAIFGRDGDWTATFNVTKMDQEGLVQDPRFSVTAYVGKHGWTTMRLGDDPDWGLIEELLETAYRKVALKRMLTALDARG